MYMEGTNMNLEQFYLLKLAEECEEVAQRALKAMQYGFDESEPNQSLTNKQRLHSELNDLHAAIEMLNNKSNLLYYPDFLVIEQKKIKVEKYLKYSQKLGQVDVI